MTAGREAARGAPVKIAYCDGPRLRRALLAAHRYLSSHRAELNRINVFPVADGDTGTNLALTLRAVADAVRPLDTLSVSEVAGTAAEASVLGARGNSGMLVSRLLLGFSRALGSRIRAGTRELAEALHAAASSLSDALETPVEGTILTVARETAAEALRHADRRRDLYEWLREVREAARCSLEETRGALPALREAGVVDAGAMGFVGMLEGTLRYIEGRPLGAEGTDRGGAPAEAVLPGDDVASAGSSDASQEGRYCTQLVVRGPHLPSPPALRGRLDGLGTSLAVVRAGEIARVHIHADDPAAVEARLEGVGEVETRRVEDTRAVKVTGRVAVVTDSSADLPRAWAQERGVEVVPLQVVLGERTFRDGVELGPDELLEILRDPSAPAPSTSQAPPGAFLEAYRRGLEAGADAILGVFLSAALSGTYDSALAAARSLEDARWELVDSRSASLGLGMMVVRAVELLEEGWPLDDVMEEVRRIRDRSNLFFTVEDLDGLLRSGRVGRAKAWLGNLLGLRPVLTLDGRGEVVPHGRARGREGARTLVVGALDRALGGVDRCRLGVVHAGLPEFARELADDLERRYRPVEVYCRPLTAVIAAHLGAGAWGVCYQVED